MRSKILYLHQYFKKKNESGGIRSYFIANYLSKYFHINLISSCSHKGESEFYKYQNFKLLRFYIPYNNKFNYIKRVIIFFTFFYKAFFKSLSLKFDIIYATSTPLTAGVLGLILSKIKKKPFVFEVRDLWPEMPIAVGEIKNKFLIKFFEWIEKIIYLNASAIVALSPDMKKTIVNKGILSSKILVIPNMSNLEFNKIFLKKKNISSSNPVIIYAGTFGLINNVIYLVQLAKNLRKIKSNIKIYLYGDGQDYKKILMLSEKYEVLNNNFFVSKPLPKNDIIKAIQSSTVSCSIVNNSIKEIEKNSANKFFDSLALGKPIFINYGGWQSKILKKYSCGISIQNKNILSVAQTLHKKLNDKNWVNKSGKNSFIVAKKFFDKELLCKQVYHTLLNISKSNFDFSKIAPGKY